jgi:hypothetical protein
MKKRKIILFVMASSNKPGMFSFKEFFKLDLPKVTTVRKAKKMLKKFKFNVLSIFR